MSDSEVLSVLIVDQSIDHKGVLTNAAFVLGLTAGRELPVSAFGEDVTDGDGQRHKYLTKLGHFVRKAGQSKLRAIREKLSGLPGVTIVDYPEDAAPSDYNQYATSLAGRKREEINYRAMHIIGPGSVVSPLTKNLSRLD